MGRRATDSGAKPCGASVRAARMGRCATDPCGARIRAARNGSVRSGPVRGAYPRSADGSARDGLGRAGLVPRSADGSARCGLGRTLTCGLGRGPVQELVSALRGWVGARRTRVRSRAELVSAQRGMGRCAADPCGASIRAARMGRCAADPCGARIRAARMGRRARDFEAIAVGVKNIFTKRSCLTAFGAAPARKSSRRARGLRAARWRRRERRSR
jgi:hypothetical protein